MAETEAAARGRRLLASLEMWEYGVELTRLRLRREDPGASPAEIESRLRVWLRHPAGAEHGDAVGHPVPLAQ